jgi:aspartate aminotransferase
MATSSEGKSLFAARTGRIEVSATMAINAEAVRLRSEGADLVDFGAGEPHFATPQHIKEAAIAAINGNFTKYTAVAGIVELRDAIRARHAADFGSDYKREEVIVSVGGKHAIFNAFLALVDHGDEVIIPVPYWVSFKDIVQFAGGKCVFVQTDEAQGFRLTAEMVEKAITPRTKVILLNSPSNPSGAVISPEDMGAIIRMAAARGIWVMSDECYVYLNYSGKNFSAGSLTDCKDKLVIVGSLSKTYSMTGWRLGFTLAPAAVIKQVEKLQSQSTSNPTSIVQKAAITALNGSQDCVKQMATEYVQLRDRIVAGLQAIPGVKCHKPEGAFYVYPNISAFLGKGEIKTASDLSRALLHKAHLVTVPGEAFGTDAHIRLSYATTAEQIDKGLERMKKFLAEL